MSGMSANTFRGLLIRSGGGGGGGGKEGGDCSPSV